MEYPYSIVTNMIAWPSICVGIAAGPAAGVTIAGVIGFLVAKAAQR